MSGAVAIGVTSIVAANIERLRRQQGCMHLEHIVIATTMSLALIGIGSTFLAVFGAFNASSVSVGCLGIGAALWPWRQNAGQATRTAQPMAKRRTDRVFAIVAVGLVAGGVALRLPFCDYALAGRDQGTYTLRAEHTVRTGGLGLVDPVVATAGVERQEYSGPADLLGLYPKRGEPWRARRYEAAYRPGWYLTDRDRGVVVPQFLHLHPMLMATAALVTGLDHMSVVVTLQAALSILGFICVARRLWPTGPWAWLAGGLYATSPLLIWVQRNALSEVTTGLFLLSAASSVTQARDDDPRPLERAAFMLGAIAWVRGNGWLAAPVFLGVLWLIPGQTSGRRRPIAIYVLTVLAGVWIHAGTIFPYLNDELARQFGGVVQPTPAGIASAAALVAIGWLCVDELAVHNRPDRAFIRWLRDTGPKWLVCGTFAAVTVYLVIRLMSPARPFSRLDPAWPAFGPWLLAASLVGAAVGWRRWKVNASQASVWLVGISAMVVMTAGLYSPRNLPQAGLYYYGRYLTPELLPATILLATAGLTATHRLLARSKLARFRPLPAITTAGLVATVWWSHAGTIVRNPTTRLQEFAGADRIVDAIANAVGPDAIVVAGGEGWHHGHTFNQVGGALAATHGISVLPYRSREAVDATLHELLVAGPRRRQQPARPVFVLINEATHPYRSTPEEPKIAAFDDLLPATVRATSVQLIEMLVHRLTPVTESLPTRVTRDELRMALVRVIAADRAPTRQWTLSDASLPSGIRVHGDQLPGPHGLCLAKGDTIIEFEALDRDGPVSVTLIATPGTAPFNATWRIMLDDRAYPTNMPRAHRRARDSLGPFVMKRPPRMLKIQGATRTVPDAPCPHGGLAGIRLLPPEHSAFEDVEPTAITYAPPLHLGHPVVPTRWVAGRGLSRYRSTLRANPEVEAVSLRLEGEAPLEFGLEPMPGQGRDELDVIVTLTGTRVGPETRLVLEADGRELTRIDPPDDRRTSWQSRPFAWKPAGAAARFRLRLESPSGPGEAQYVLVRDIGLFSRTTRVSGRVAAP